MFFNYRTNGVTGNIIRNKKASCYLMQEDYFQPFLSVMEMMTLACNLKLKSGMYELIESKVE